MIPISSTSTLFESLFVEIWKKNSHYQKYIIGNIYRLPVYVADDLNVFINEFTDLLIVLRARSKSVFLCGDYNIDLLKINANDNFNMFYENVISSSFIPSITLPTRICDTTSMCSLAVSTQDSPAVEPRSNPGSGKILMSENLRLYTTSPVVMC